MRPHSSNEWAGVTAGEAVLPLAVRLASKYVIHAVGPVWEGGTSGEARDRSPDAIANLCALPTSLGLNSIAFPQSPRACSDIRLSRLSGGDPHGYRQPADCAASGITFVSFCLTSSHLEAFACRVWPDASQNHRSYEVFEKGSYEQKESNRRQLEDVQDA